MIISILTNIFMTHNVAITLVIHYTSAEIKIITPQHGTECQGSR
jgi:hypothetical protein